MAQMSRLLDEALPLDQAQRQKWLDQLPVEYADIESALRNALLTAGEPSGHPAVLGMLPLFDRSPVAAADGDGLQPGQHLGPYELIRVLGSGGMAMVWLARRADGAFKRDLALKLPMFSRLRADLPHRFARERDILASLEHPHIARLYDAGVSAEGLPYLAMEYVEGQILTEWCNAHRLAIHERLRLFLQVLDAVEYAHGRHVIHRDLKPSNILVTDSGQVRLLDFGVAKLITEGNAAAERMLTARFGQALTPEYASPELIRGEPDTFATDVYALGVVLYELLTGDRPYQLEPGRSIAQLTRSIESAKVERPSTKVTVEAAVARATTKDVLARLMHGRLDAIVLKALAHEAHQRCPSAAAMADDIQHFLDASAVQARGLSLKRWPAWVGSLIAGLAILVGSSIWLLPSAVWPWHSNALPSVVPVAGKPSIAVLPFDNMSQDPEQGYFSDGITEDLITDLSKVAGLLVIARNSTFVYKGQAHDIREIAKALGVRYVLEGSVRKNGTDVRVNAQLVDGATGGHVWADRFDGNLKDLFGLQDTVTRQVIKALSVELTKDDNDRVTRRGTDNVQAFDRFLKGRERFLKQTPEDFSAAIVEFKKAAEVDPDYGRARAALAETYWESYARNWGPVMGLGPRNRDSHYLAEKALDEAMKAPTPLAHQVASAMLLHAQQHQDAIAEARLAIAEDPNDADGYAVLAGALSFSGKTAEALAAIEHAMLLNPHYPSTYLYQRGLAQFVAQRLSDASTSLEQAMAQSPADYWSQRLLLATYGLLGRNANAARLIAAMKGGDRRGWTASFDPLTITAVSYWYPFLNPDDAHRFADGLRKAGVPD